MFYLDEEYQRYEEDAEIDEFIMELIWFFLV